MSLNWVMLSADKQIIRLPNEEIRLDCGSRISLELSVPKGLDGKLSLRSDAGQLFLTSHRIIYLPHKPTPELQSFSVPILNVQDSYVSSPWFGSWYWTGLIKPVSQGGIPPELVRVKCTLSFNEGGHNEFRQKFEEIKEHLYQMREMARETGREMALHDEPLPAYEPSYDNAPPPASAPPVDPTPPEPTSPSDPPPNYDQAQMQTLAMRLEDHVRTTAEHQ